MSRTSGKRVPEPRFLTDRMLGTLGRYLRFMGYDTLSANSLTPGNRREDSLLLGISRRDHRVLLTRDRELARRGGEHAIFMRPVDVVSQVQEIGDLGLVISRLRMNRCSVCNELLRRARLSEISGTSYAPKMRAGTYYFWCASCRKLYWTGSHANDIANRLKKGIRKPLASTGNRR